jgi:hypothetical protein
VGSGQDAEIQLYSAAAIPGYTAEQHKSFHAALVKYFDAEAKVITLLQAWRAGDPPPANLGEAAAALNEALTVLKPMSPTSLAKVITYVQQGITALQHVLALTKGGA